MPWTAWLCITVLFTYGFAQETLQYSGVQNQRNPNSNVIPNHINFQSDVTNALSFTMMNQINQRSEPTNGMLPEVQSGRRQTPRYPMREPDVRMFPHPMPSGNVQNMHNQKRSNFQGLRNKPQFQRNVQSPGFRIVNTNNVEDEITWKDYLENAVPWPVCETFVHGLSFTPRLLPDQLFRDWVIGQGCQEVLFKIAIPMFSKMVGHSFNDMHF